MPSVADELAALQDAGLTRKEKGKLKNAGGLSTPEDVDQRIQANKAAIKHKDGIQAVVKTVDRQTDYFLQKNKTKAREYKGKELGTSTSMTEAAKKVSSSSRTARKGPSTASTTATGATATSAKSTSPVATRNKSKSHIATSSTPAIGKNTFTTTAAAKVVTPDAVAKTTTTTTTTTTSALDTTTPHPKAPKMSQIDNYDNHDNDDDDDVVPELNGSEQITNLVEEEQVLSDIPILDFENDKENLLTTTASTTNMELLDDNNYDDDNDDDGATQHSSKQNRAEKKTRKMLQKIMGLHPIPGIVRVTFKLRQQGVFVIDKPEVFGSSSSGGSTSRTFVVLGEAKSLQQQQTAAAQAAKKFQAPIPSTGMKALENTKDDDNDDVPNLMTSPVTTAEAAPLVDETGLEARDIELVMSQASCSRTKAVKALKENDGDLVNAIMAVTI